jgi:hypothetical protein
MVNSYRSLFNLPFLPFFAVQLHPFRFMPNDEFLPNFRIAQLKTLLTQKNIFLASAVDLGLLLL